MILIVHQWYCTMCGHSKTFDPQKDSPPEKCPACGEGTGYEYVKNVDSYRAPKE